MNVVSSPPDVAELLPIIRQKLDGVTVEELLAVHRLLLEMEAERLMKSIGEAVDKAGEDGLLAEDSIQQSILDHRLRHPYNP